MADTHPLRRLLDRLRRRPDEPPAEPLPAPVDPETIHARDGDVSELAGLAPSDRLDAAEGEDRP